MDDKGIGARLERLRMRVGDTQREFCKKINMMQANYASVVAGRRSITTKMIFAIQEHYGTSTCNEILFGENEKQDTQTDRYMRGDTLGLIGNADFIYRRDMTTEKKLGYISLYARNNNTGESFNFKEVLTKCADGCACVVLERYIHGLRFIHTLDFNDFKFIE